MPTSPKCMHMRCQKPRRSGQVFCREHWRQLPEPLKAAIWDAHRRKDRGASLRNIRSAIDYLNNSGKEEK